jgi:exopolyphosphatase/pppGpp-phosphohydrolase
MSAPIILEFGSHSLKVHYQSSSSGVFRKVRFAWDLGHEVYSTGTISERTAHKAVETILALRHKGVNPRSLLAIATGALRDAENSKEFLTLLENKLALQVRVISGREEASLLAQGYLEQSKKLPALLADVGGGSLEIVYLAEDKSILRDSLPLGAIRLYHLGCDGKNAWNEHLVSSWIENTLEEASLVTAEEIHCTGGTGKAIATVFDRPAIAREEIQALGERVRREGPPAAMSPDRAKVFLPGLMVLCQFMEHSQARTLRYLKVPLGRIFLQRLTSRLNASASPERKKFMLQDLRITSIYPKAPKRD